MNDIGKNIRRLREERGLTQEELAIRIGYQTRTAINKIELGMRDLPQSKIVLCAEALGVTPAVLMGWVEEDESVKNDVLANIVMTLRKDDDLLQLVAKISQLSPERRQNLAPVIDAFLAAGK